MKKDDNSIADYEKECKEEIEKCIKHYLDKDRYFEIHDLEFHYGPKYGSDFIRFKIVVQKEYTVLSVLEYGWPVRVGSKKCLEPNVIAFIASVIEKCHREKETNNQ